MILQDLLKQFDLDLELNEELLQKEIKGDYKNSKKEKRILNVASAKGKIKQEFTPVILYGKDCECCVEPSCNWETVKVSYKVKDMQYGYSYDKNGNVSSIV